MPAKRRPGPPERTLKRNAFHAFAETSQGWSLSQFGTGLLGIETAVYGKNCWPFVAGLPR